MSDFSSSIAEMVKDVHATSKQKGWWVDPRRPLEVHALIISEIAEATEQVREGRPDMYQEFNHQYDPETRKVDFYYAEYGEPNWDSSRKPEGELVELADAVIRIMDYCGYKGWDLGSAILAKHNFNKTRPYKHGKLL